MCCQVEVWPVVAQGGVALQFLTLPDGSSIFFISVHSDSEHPYPTFYDRFRICLYLISDLPFLIQSRIVSLSAHHSSSLAVQSNSSKLLGIWHCWHLTKTLIFVLRSCHEILIMYRRYHWWNFSNEFVWHWFVVQASHRRNKLAKQWSDKPVL